MPLFNLFFVPVCLLSMACSRRQHKPADLSAAAVALPAPVLPNTTDSVPDQVFFSTDNGRSCKIRVPVYHLPPVLVWAE